MYSYSDLFNLRLRYVVQDSEDFEEIIPDDNISNKHLEISGSSINLTYNNKTITTKDQIVIIPVAYSDDWEFTSSQVYDKISVSGGFLGVIIPKGTEMVDISLKFTPKYLDLGLYVSLGSLSVYLLIFVTPLMLKKKKEVN
jgi:uncharacterized membrane protein YfhO